MLLSSISVILGAKFPSKSFDFAVKSVYFTLAHAA